MEILFGVLLGLFVLVLLVVVHELGHAIVARRNGVVVEEFGIGFPPRAWGKKLKNGVEFTLNWLPLGGFVKLQGEHDSANGKGDYGAASFWVKTKILLAGVGINWLVAALLLTVLALTGLPKVLPNQFTVASDTTEQRGDVTIAAIADGYPAEDAGFQRGDVIRSVAGSEIASVDQFIERTKEYSGRTVAVVYERDGSEQTQSVALRDDDTSVFGANLQQSILQRSTWSAPIVGFGLTTQLTLVTLQGVGDLLVNFVQGVLGKLSLNESTRESAGEKLTEVSQNVAGPVGILGVLFPSVQQAGLTQIVFFSALISLTLAVMNVLPIPALDGGRWFTMAVFRLLKKPLTKDREEAIQGTGFMVLFGLIILVTISDIGKFF